MNLAPIVLFVYNRPWHTRQTVEALQKCELAKESDLYIFADGPKEDASDETRQKIAEVRQYIYAIDGFKSIHIQESPTNKGLANSVIHGVSEVIEKCGKVIVVEDDIVAHPFFLRFINEALNFYEKDNRIFSIGGFNYRIAVPQTYKHDVYIVHRAESHGWGTWLNRWNDVDWSIADASSFFKNKRERKLFNRGGKDMSNMLKAQLNGDIDSWAIRWDYHLYKHNAYCLRPVKSLVKNIGFDGTGTHCGEIDTDMYSAPLYNCDNYSIRLVKEIGLNNYVAKSFYYFFSGEDDAKVLIIKKIIRKIKKKTKCLLKNIVSNFIKKDINNNTTWYGGKDYGGFAIDDSQLKDDSIVYSFGIGEDTSFSEDLIARKKCTIFAFDPTPRAIDFVNNRNLGVNFLFSPIGLADHDGTETWYYPKNRDWVSLSAFNHEQYNANELSENTITVEVRRLDTLMQSFGHTRIDLLKLDIEGSEFKVIPNILNARINVRQITLEIHSTYFDNSRKKIKRIFHMLKKHGYRTIYYHPEGDFICTFLK